VVVGITKVWNLETGTLMRTLNGRHVDDVDTVAISPNGLLVASAAADKTIKLWKLHTGQEPVRSRIQIG